MGQPQGSAEWATNELYVSPGDPWDGNPTKVSPPIGKRDEGYEPTEEGAAQFFNDWQNRAGALLEHLRLMQPSNWTLERDISPTTPQSFKGIGYDASTGTLIATGDTADVATFLSADGGRFWFAPSAAPLSIVARGIAADDAGNWVLVGDSLSCSESGDDGDNWTTRTLGLADDQGNQVVYDPTNALWIVTGENVGGGAGRRIWTSPDRSAWTVRLTDASGFFVGDIWTNAAGFSVALSNGGTFFTSPDGTTWTLRSVAGATALNGVTYSEAAGLWMITGTDGARAVFTSTDGITFTKPAGQVLDNKTLPNVNCDQGDLFLIGFGSSSPNAEIYASVDRGLTWVQVTGFGPTLPRGPSEGQPTPTGSGSVAQDLEFFAGKFMRVDDAGNFWHSLAMS